MQVCKQLILLTVSSILPLTILSCGGNRVNVEFKTSPQIYVDDSRTDPDQLNRELEYDLRETEKKRRQKQQEAETAAKTKTEAERNAGVEQKPSEQTTEGEILKPENAEQSSMLK
jgi:hypothetical protein